MPKPVLGLKQREAAKRLGVVQGTVSKMLKAGTLRRLEDGSIDPDSLAAFVVMDPNDVTVDMDYYRERTRKLRADASRVESEVERMRRGYINRQGSLDTLCALVSMLEAAVWLFVRTVPEAIWAIPERTEPTVREVFEKALYDCLIGHVEEVESYMGEPPRRRQRRKKSSDTTYQYELGRLESAKADKAEILYLAEIGEIVLAKYFVDEVTGFGLEIHEELENVIEAISGQIATSQSQAAVERLISERYGEVVVGMQSDLSGIVERFSEEGGYVGTA